ncbi:hypothetical protein C8R46DRAFT_1228028 [Mycena filopes]|nr:hypothetical protein C8R46DRAFT_1228028 [Mycena filopes]
MPPMYAFLRSLSLFAHSWLVERSPDTPKSRQMKLLVVGDAPRRSPRFMKPSATLQRSPNDVCHSPTFTAEYSSGKKSLIFANDTTNLRFQFPLKRCSDLESELVQKQKRCSDLESELAKKQDDLNRREAQFDDFMVTFEDMSNQRMDRDNEISDLRNDLNLYRQSGQETTKAKDDLTALYTQQRIENSNLQQRLDVLGKELRLVSGQRTSLERQMLSLSRRLEKAEGSSSSAPDVELFT